MMATFNQVMDVLLKWPVLEIGDSESIDVGADVLAIGNGKLFGVAVSSGVISRTNAWIANPETGFAVNRLEPKSHCFRFDAAVNPGNSGGPLIHRQTGSVIGVVTFGMSANLRMDYDAFYFAQHAKILKAFVAQACSRLSRPTDDEVLKDSGLQTRSNVTTLRYTQLPVTFCDGDSFIGQPVPRVCSVHGEVTAVVQVGDIVIEVGGRPVSCPLDVDFTMRILHHPPDSIMIKVRRGGGEVELSVLLITVPVRIAGSSFSTSDLLGRWSNYVSGYAEYGIYYPVWQFYDLWMPQWLQWVFFVLWSWLLSDQFAELILLKLFSFQWMVGRITMSLKCLNHEMAAAYILKEMNEKTKWSRHERQVAKFIGFFAASLCTKFFCWLFIVN